VIAFRTHAIKFAKPETRSDHTKVARSSLRSS
jgi:hypothetical protein